MATVKEVARRAKVSVGTVSNVLSGTVPVSERLRDRVMQVVRDLDYQPNLVARSLKIRQTKMLGMVVSDLTNPFFPQVVRGAEEAAWQRHYMLLIFNCDDRVERERQVVAALRARRVDGILLVAASSEGNLDHIRATVDAGTPVVCLDRTLDSLALDSVTVDNTGGVQECIEHFLATGHQRIGIVTGPLHLRIARDRLAGYRKALLASGVPYREELVAEGDFREQGGYMAALRLLREQRPTAVFASNAMMALGLLRAISECRLRCPNDVVVATFDDPVFSEALRPRLTSVAQPAYELGRKGAEMLIRRIERDADPPSALVLKTRLEVRESSQSEGLPWSLSAVAAASVPDPD